MFKDSSKVMNLWKKFKYKTNRRVVDGFYKIWIYGTAEKL